MQIQLHNLSELDLEWFVETAAVNMLIDELNRPELLNLDQQYLLANKGLVDKTAFVVKQDGINIGALGAILVPNFFNPNIITLAEVFWYVLPEYRNTRAGVLLLKAFEERAGEIADDATLSLLPSSIVNYSSITKRGFIMEEVSFRKSIKGQQWQP
jgi:GNAT superfamily N-acetyltransferase